jgi:nitrite reductase (NADH) large subunit
VRFVVIGNGVAGFTASRSISAAAPDAQVEIYTDELHPYYWRPRLLDLLAGRVTVEDIYAFPVEWYAERGIALHLGSRLVELRVSSKSLVFDDGTEASYDLLLLATGSAPLVPAVEGVEKKGSFTLRSIEDALAIKAYAQRCMSAGLTEAVVVGGGLLGLESANALTSLGLRVTVLEHGPWLLHRQVDEEGAAVLQEQIEGLGVGFELRATPRGFAGDDAVSGVVLQDGRTLPACLVLCSAGVRPNTDLASRAGLAVNRGVLVDERMRTSADGIYAAGDVAEYDGELPCIIPVAVEQGRVAGANMVNSGSAVYAGAVPLTTLKIVGLDLTSIGLIAPEEEGYQELRKAELARGVYQKLVLEGGRIVGAILLGDRTRVPAISRLIKEGRDVSAYSDRLLDDDFDLQAIT